MKFDINKERLLRVLLHLKSAVPTYRMASNSVFCYLYRSFIFTAKSDFLRVEATDGEVFVSEEMSLLEPIEDTKIFALDAAQLLSAIKSLDDQPLTFEVLEYQVIVHHEIGHFALPITSGIENYGELPKAKVEQSKAHYQKIEAPGLKSILARCAYAMADDALRPCMNGVFMDCTKEGTNFAASDGHKLIRISKPSLQGETGMIIPKKVVSILLKVLPDTDFVQIWYNPYLPNLDEEEAKKTPRAACEITVDDITICFRPIEGRFPNYNNVIPTRHNYTLTVDRKALIKSLDRLSLFGNDCTGLITVYVEELGKLVMKSEDKDFETSAVETLPCNYNGKDMRIGFKDRSLIQTLRNLNTKDVTFYLIDQNTAIIIGPTIQPESEEITALLMPMYIND